MAEDENINYEDEVNESDTNFEGLEYEETVEEEVKDEQERFISIFEILDAPRELPEPINLSIDIIKQIQSELGIITLCWPDVKDPTFENRVNFPETYVKNSNKEKLLLLYAENFRRQFIAKFPNRKPLFLAAPNEVGLVKMVCTTLRSTKLPHKEIETWDKCASFVGDQLRYEPLVTPTLLPTRLYSPHSVFLRQSGHSFEIAGALCSLLLGLGYDAYVVSGYATQDVCLKVMTRVDSPFPVEEEKKAEEVKVTVESKYMFRPPKDLRSKYLLMMEQREIDKVLNAQRKAEEEERRRIEEIERPPFDELYGQRLHAWVLLLSGTKGVTNSVFIESTTGYVHSLNSPLYCGIESVWNATNYWVNLQDCSHGLENLDFNFSNLENWEHLIIGEPLKYRETRITNEMEEEDIRIKKIMEEKHLDMPTPWSLPIYISQKILSLRYPGGVKKTWYKRAMVEEFAPYVQEDGLGTRICRYKDFECSPSEMYMIEEHYKNRTDNLIKIVSDCNTGLITEFYRRGREDAVKNHIYTAGHTTSVESERIIEYYHQARHDGLAKQELGEVYMTEHYVEPENRIYYRHVDYAKRGKPPPGILEGKRRIVIKIIEKFNRNEKVAASQDISVREFAIVEREIHIKYHYAEGKVTASTRDFQKPPIAEMADQLRFNPKLTVGYQSEIGAKPPRQLKLFYLLEQQLKDEENSLYLIREMEDMVTEFLKLRHFEVAYPKLAVSLFDRVHNEEYRIGMIEREQKEKEHKEREVEDEMDYLEPYNCRLGNPSKLSKTQATQVRDWCLAEFKQMLVDRANDVQQTFERETAKLNERQNWYQSVQDTLKLDEEMDYFEEINQRMFLLHTLELRLARHRDLSPFRYEALENYLRMDKRLAILYK